MITKKSKQFVFSFFLSCFLNSLFLRVRRNFASRIGGKKIHPGAKMETFFFFGPMLKYIKKMIEIEFSRHI